MVETMKKYKIDKENYNIKMRRMSRKTMKKKIQQMRNGWNRNIYIRKRDLLHKNKKKETKK